MNRAQDPDLSAAQMQLLWVGNNEKGFTYLRDVLTRSGEGRLELDRVRSPEEALQRLTQTTYDLLLCDYKPGDGMALRLLHEIRKDGPGAPVIFLSDHVDQIAVDAAIKAGASDCLQTSNLNESPSLAPSAMPLTFTARNASGKRQKIPCASSGARSNNQPIW
jgi:CheY-like chemotaxis protein